MPLFNTVGMSLLAATPVGGYALVNGTGSIISWTAPNDGALHRFIAISSIDVTSGETGGLIQVLYKSPDGGAATRQLLAAGLTTGVQPGTLTGICEAGQTVTVAQNSALTVGAAVLWAEIWGS